MTESFISILIRSLEGWLGVFIVTLVIILLITLLNMLTSGKKEKKR